MRIARTVLALAAAAIAATARAAEPVPELHVADVVADALARNPEIHAARARAGAAAAVPARVSAWDDPTIGWEAWNVPESFRIDRADNNIFRVAQKVPFPGKRRLAGVAAEHEAAMAEAESAATALDVALAARRAYWDLWQLVEQQRVTERDRVLVDRLARVTTDRYAVGQALQADLVRAEVERTHVDTRLATLALAIESARAELAGVLSSDAPVLGTPADGPLLVLPADEAGLAARALRERPEIRAQVEAVAREESAVQLARLGTLPDFEVAVSRFVNAGAADGFGAMASLTVPLAFPSKYQAASAEAAARLGVAKAEQRRVEDRIRREVRQAWLGVQAALTQHQLFRGRHVPHAEQALAATRTAYEAGQTGAAALFESVRAVQAVELEHVTAAADFERAMATLARAVGGDVPRDGAAHAEAHDARR